MVPSNFVILVLRSQGGSGGTCNVADLLDDACGTEEPPPPRDVLERPYTVGGALPPPPPPLPMFEADSQKFASAPSVPRGFKLKNFGPAFGGDQWGGPRRRGSQPTPPSPSPPSDTSLAPRHPLRRALHNAPLPTTMRRLTAWVAPTAVSEDETLVGWRVSFLRPGIVPVGAPPPPPPFLLRGRPCQSNGWCCFRQVVGLQCFSRKGGGGAESLGGM